MKVLLLEDVDNLGYAGDVKEVANGFGRNYLIPQQLAVLATPGALKQSETIRKAAEKRRAQEKADAEAIANQVGGLKLLFERRAGETGKLYGSVTSGDIAEAIQEKTGIEIDKRKVALAEPIRNLGDQQVTIKLMIEVATDIGVEVVPLGGVLERERLAEAVDLEAEDAPVDEAPPATETPAEEAVEVEPEDEETTEARPEDEEATETEPEDEEDSE